MNTKAQEAKGMSPADLGKLALALVVLVAGIVGFYYFSDNPSVPSFARVAGVIVAVAAAMAISAFTAPGRKLRGFVAESQFEMRKVVWPTRQETIRTTAVVILVVVILSVLLGLIDVFLKWAILDHLLKIGT